MAKQKSIPELEAEKPENERKLSQLQHKKQQIENRITYYEKGDRRKRAHHLTPYALRELVKGVYIEAPTRAAANGGRSSAFPMTLWVLSR